MSAPYETCAKCGRSRPIDEMRAIRERVVAGYTSGHTRQSSSSGGTQGHSWSAGTPSRNSSSHSQRTGTTRTGGTTRYNFEDRYYCEATGCYQVREGEHRRDARLLFTLLIGLAVVVVIGACVLVLPGVLKGLGGHVEDTARGDRSPEFTSTESSSKERGVTPQTSASESASANPPSVDQDSANEAVPTAPQPESAATQQASRPEAPTITPNTNPQLGEAVNEALAKGEVVRWSDNANGVRGEISVSGPQTYADKVCRSYRYTIRTSETVVTSEPAIGCKPTDGEWGFANSQAR